MSDPCGGAARGGSGCVCDPPWMGDEKPAAAAVAWMHRADRAEAERDAALRDLAALRETIGDTLRAMAGQYPDSAAKQAALLIAAEEIDAASGSATAGREHHG